MRQPWLFSAWILCAASFASAQEQGPVLNAPPTGPMPRMLPLPAKEMKESITVPNPVPFAPPFVVPPPSSTVPPIQSMPGPMPSPFAGTPGLPPAPLLPPYVPPSRFPSVPLLPTDPYPIRTVEEELKKLRAAREELEATYRNGPTTTHVAESKSIDHDELLLRLRLGDVLQRLHDRHSRPAAPRPLKQPNQHETDPHATTTHAPPEPPKTPMHDDHGVAKADLKHPVDALALAHSLFLAKNYPAALEAFRKLDLKDYRPEDRMPIQCLMASCLREVGRADEARGIYLKLANAKDDDQIAEIARWQLEQMRWRKQLIDAIEAVRARRQSLEKGP